MRRAVLVIVAVLTSIECAAQSAPAGATRDLSAYKSKAVTQTAIPPSANAPVFTNQANCATTACLTKRVAYLEALVAAQHEKIVLLEAAVIRNNSVSGVLAPANIRGAGRPVSI